VSTSDDLRSTLSVRASLSNLGIDKTQMILAELESSPTSAKYSINICGKVAGISGVENISS
jgi:hypothetical protein